MFIFIVLFFQVQGVIVGRGARHSSVRIMMDVSQSKISIMIFGNDSL
jgi:hypothetical protein